jgi:hypothetical protein
MAVTFMESLHVNRHAVTAACQSLRYLVHHRLDDAQIKSHDTVINRQVFGK